MDLTTSGSASVLKPAAATGASAPPGLPESPLVTIRPGESWGLRDLRDLWAYRELLYFLTWRDIKVRYKQTALGAAWAVVQPLMMTIIFTVFLGMLARVPSQEGVPYPLMVYAGLLPWTFFSTAVLGSGQSLVGNSHLITKVYFPRLIVPAAAIAARLVDLGVGCVILVGMMAYYRAAPGWGLVALPAVALLMVVLTTGFGLLLAAMNVRYRDVGFVLPVLIQLWMYVSPVLYPVGLVPARWRVVYDLNPMVGVIDGFRSALFGAPFNAYALGVSSAAALLLLAYSVRFFSRVEKGFSDVI